MTKKHPSKLTNNISMLYLHLFLNFINKNYMEANVHGLEGMGITVGLWVTVWGGGGGVDVRGGSCSDTSEIL